MTASKSIVKILFPHTYLSRNRCEKLNSYFGRISLYQPDIFHIPPPVQKMSDQGLLEIRIPIAEKQEELRSIRNAFLQWADLQGRDLGAAAAYHRFLDAGSETFHMRINLNLPLIKMFGKKQEIMIKIRIKIKDKSE